MSRRLLGPHFRELHEPQKLLPYLLQSDIGNLSSDVVAMYLQAALKVFGYWASELAQRWDDESLPEVKQVVESILSRVGELASSQYIEVQERVRMSLYPVESMIIINYPVGGKHATTFLLHSSRYKLLSPEG